MNSQIHGVRKVINQKENYITVPSHIDESNTGPDRNSGCGTTNGSDGKIIITPHLITIHLISTMGCNFTQLSDPIGSDCKIRSDSTVWIR
jgi:hypothetical protein